VGIENNNDWNFRDLAGMRENTKSLKKNTWELEGILIGPLKAPVLSLPLRFLRGGFFAHCPRYQVGFGPKFRGADGKPTN
jgi:hypothetical protein